MPNRSDDADPAADQVAAKLDAVRREVEAIAARHGRAPGSVAVLAVSKTKPPAAVVAAYAAGQRDFGENFLQDAEAKLDAVPDDVRWHFIGAIQSNKTRRIAERFAFVHTVDRLRVATRLAAQRPETLAPLEVCVQVNVDDEASKAGVQPDAALALAREVAALPRLRLRGFMSIPRPASDLATQRVAHARLRALLEEARADGLDVDTLSMGMSADLEAAIAEGATLVRVGTAIFGAREPRAPT